MRYVLRVAGATVVAAMLMSCERCASASGALTSSSMPAPPMPRLVILGFDGVDPRRVDTLVRAGRLPNVKRLEDTGGHRGTLATTNPPQSPVAWAAFATGAAPGEHGIFDFVRRDPQTYMPRVATTQVRHAQVRDGTVVPAEVENLRRGDAFWDVVARAGIAARTITVPYAYPPIAGGARALTGLGTPDLRGTNSSFTWLVTQASRVQGPAPAGGQYALLEPTGPNAWTATLEGPVLGIEGVRTPTRLPVTVTESEGGRVTVRAGGAKAALALGETSPYMQLEWPVAPALRLAAATRFTVRGVDPPMLYVEPLSMTPKAPYLPVAAPTQYGIDTWTASGPYKTVGWQDDTSALGAGAIDEEQFLREAHATMQWTERAVLRALKEGTDALLVAVMTSPDRIAHMFYRAIDANHPGRDAQAKRFASAVDDSYIEMDRIVGEVTAVLGNNDTLLVMSDHGFASFRRGVNLNTWLAEAGYMKFKSHGRERGDLFADVDWTATQAYAFGTGSIYLNVAGREARGIVPPGEAPALAQRLARSLVDLRDGRTNVVADVALGDTLYEGPARDAAPDLRVAFVEGYRASWATAMGGAPADVFENNLKKWSGDHASALPQDVPGLLLSNRPIGVQAPRIEDLSATAYAFAGVTPPITCRGRPLVQFGDAGRTR